MEYADFVYFLGLAAGIIFGDVFFSGYDTRHGIYFPALRAHSVEFIAHALLVHYYSAG